MTEVALACVSTFFAGVVMTSYLVRSVLNKRNANLRRIANDLKRTPICMACETEGQERWCVCHDAKWAGREILRTLDRPGWETRKLMPKKSAPDGKNNP